MGYAAGIVAFLVLWKIASRIDAAEDQRISDEFDRSPQGRAINASIRVNTAEREADAARAQACAADAEKAADRARQTALARDLEEVRRLVAMKGPPPGM